MRYQAERLDLEWARPELYARILSNVEALLQELPTTADWAFTDTTTIEFVIGEEFAVTLRDDKTNGFFVSITSGFYTRLMLLDALVLTEWTQPRNIEFMFSPLDVEASQSFYIPPKLRPMFQEDESQSIHARTLFESITWSRVSDADLEWVLTYQYFYAILHEFGHIAARHTYFRRRVEESERFGNTKTIGYSEEELFQGMEVSADIFAATAMANAFAAEILGEANQPLLADSTINRIFIRASGALTLMFSSFDMYQKCLQDLTFWR